MSAPEVTILQGHVLDQLRKLPDGAVQCVVTSPPYWGLRDYSRCECATKGAWEGAGHNYGLQLPHEADQGGSFRKTDSDPNCPRCHGTGKDDSLTVVWDAKEGCDHSWTGYLTRLKWERKEYQFTSLNESAAADVGGKLASEFCERCGAWRGQLGLEPTPNLYVDHLVQVFREVTRVLRKDGTLWLNMGDCYFGDSPVRTSAAEAFSEHWDRTQTRSRGGNRRSAASANGLKPKDLIGMPWRVAFALQADGWWLRSDIIWAKPNPMPESVTDRPTKAHEYVFLLTKRGRYFYDADAVRENANPQYAARYDTPFSGSNPLIQRPDNAQTHPKGPRKFGGHRNLRTIWTITTHPYPEAHFATFPEELAEPCIKAGSRRGDTVLDPFAGSGTVGAVARGLGRSSILIEIKADYIELIRKRVRTDLQPLSKWAD